MRKFRIGIALSLFPPVVGGAELLLLELARRWVHRGHTTTVFTRPQPDTAAVETIDGIVVRRVIRTLDMGPLFGLTFVASLGRAISKHRDDFDVLVAFQAPWESAATGWMGPRLPGVPTIAVVQQSGPFGDVARLQQSRFASRLRSWLLNHRAFVGLSEHAKSELVDLGCPAEHVHVIRNGIDLGRFGRQRCTEPLTRGSTEPSKAVLFVGRFMDQKNPLALLEAWKSVNAESAYRLLLVGAGELESKMREYCDLERLHNVDFLGRRSDMPGVYQQASVFVLPSLGEGCCMALLEAMAGGLCPVVTAVGGNLDVVTNEVNGLLVPPNDPAALATALRRVLDDAAARQRFGEAAAMHIKCHHDIDDVADQYLELFESALKG